MGRQRRSDRRARLARASALVLTAFLGSELALITHQLTVDHVTCAEHGELMHVGEPSSDSAGSHTDDVASPHDARAWVAGTHAPADTDHTHEHCVATAQTGEKIDFPPCPSTHEAPDNPRRSWLCRQARHPAAVDLYTLAPKNSPPPHS